jgi:soluble lytic murein transglycosylase-like protein
MKAALIALVIRIATIYGVPPYLMVAIAEVESNWNTNAININTDGTLDRGLMQLNTSWYTDDNWADPETNITAAAKHILFLKSFANFNWYQVCVAYNCGVARMNNPPEKSIAYAIKVFEVWALYDRRFIYYVGE